METKKEYESVPVLRNMVPALVTQMIVLFKDTSLASIIGC